MQPRIKRGQIQMGQEPREPPGLREKKKGRKERRGRRGERMGEDKRKENRKGEGRKGLDHC